MIWRSRRAEMSNPLERVETTAYSGRAWTFSASAASRFPTLLFSQEKVTTVAVAGEKPPVSVDVSDESLLSRICSGDQEALAALFERYARLTRSVAVRILRDAAEAEDLVQDLFLFIQRKCGIFDSSKSTARSWIVQMAYHRALERRRYLTTRQFYSRAQIQREAEMVVGMTATESDYSAEEVFGRN